MIGPYRVAPRPAESGPADDWPCPIQPASPHGQGPFVPACQVLGPDLSSPPDQGLVGEEGRPRNGIATTGAPSTNIAQMDADAEFDAPSLAVVPS